LENLKINPAVALPIITSRRSAINLEREKMKRIVLTCDQRSIAVGGSTAAPASPSAFSGSQSVKVFLPVWQNEINRIDGELEFHIHVLVELPS
jgi:hypothetical protein